MARKPQAQTVDSKGEVRIEAGESRGGVTYLIKRTSDGRHFIITTEVGGQLPAKFEGLFTSPVIAQAEIDAYEFERR